MGVKAWSLVVLVSWLLVSCQQSTVPINAASILQTSKGGDFRGIRLGDKPSSIKREEEASSVYSMPDELIYRFDSGETDSTWYEISYSFNQDGLNHINLDVFPQGETLENHLYNEFLDYYNQRYGICRDFSNHKEWRGLTVQGLYVMVSLTREPARNGRQHLRLVFNETNP